MQDTDETAWQDMQQDATQELRYRRLNENTLLFTVTIDDRKGDTQPWNTW